MTPEEASQVARTIREACVSAALAAYEEGGASGLCAEGRWELAVDAMRSLDVDAVARDAGTTAPPRV